MCRCDDLPGDVVEHFDETALHVCVEEEIGLVEHNDFAVPKSVEVVEGCSHTCIPSPTQEISFVLRDADSL